MIRGFYTARAGLMAHQEHMSILSNNLANTNTVGFKPMRPAFRDLLYQNLNRAEIENVAQTGHGTKINKTDIMMNMGNPEATYRELDFLITDESGFFQTETAEGQIQYTKAGNFSMSLEDDVFYLVNGNGDYVLDVDGERIEIEFNEYIEVVDPEGTIRKKPKLDADGNPVLDSRGDPVMEFDLDENGNYQYDPVTRQELANPDYGEIILDSGRLALYRFPNKWGLEAIDGNAFLQTEFSGEPVLIEPVELEDGTSLQQALRQGYLEGSATEVANEMVHVIEAQRAFSFSSKMVQVADEIEQVVNSLRG
jgi:flagellar basal body rod protein FlgG